MLNRPLARIVLIAAICAPQLAVAEIKEYIRDYDYHGTDFDTRTTSRINAISGVKRELLEELGTYVGSVIKMNQDSLGNSYMSHDVVNITAGIVAMKVLNEKWNQPVYYIKAGMKADPEDVLTKLKAMRADLELEKSLRSSYEELERARAEVEELKAQLAQLKKAASSQAAAPVPVVAAAPSKPAPELLTKRMQKIEDETQKELARDLAASDKAPATVSAPSAVTVAKAPEAVAVVPAQPQITAEQAQKELSRDVLKEKAVSPLPVVAVAIQQPATVVVTTPVDVPAPAAQTPEAKKLLVSYQKAMQNIEVEEAFQRGLIAQIKGDFSTLVKEMAPLAERGYRRAQTRMGMIYERGLGVPQDYAKALAWYEKAGANGAKNAPARIGRMYELGFGVPQDYQKAAEYYKQSIALDGSLGYARMGYLHETGKGVQFDRVKAVEYYELAIAKGDHHAMTLLGLLYQKGRGGLDRDDKKAVELYKKAIDHGIALAMTRLGEMYNKGHGGLPKDNEKAIALFRESVRHKIPAAYAHLGRMYEEGWATTQDYAEARRLYEQAAEHDAIFAMKRLGFMYKDGLGVSRDHGKAIYWFKRAASLGDDKSEEQLSKRGKWR